MARISTYGIDAKPELADKVIGTDQGAEQTTKNYSLEDISDLINHTNSLGVADQTVFLFQSDISKGRKAGTISFPSGGGVGTSFTDIDSILISKTGAGDKPLENFLLLFKDKEIILANTKNINSFGTYKVLNIKEYINDNEFFQLTLKNYESNGKLEFNTFYIFSEFTNPEFSGDLNMEWVPKGAQKVWVIEHNLGKNPSVSVADSAGSWIIGEVNYINDNKLTITFNSSFSGVAYLN